MAMINTMHTNQKNCAFDIGSPIKSGLGILIPKGPSVSHVISLIKIWVIVPNAKVTIAK
jgi:hypothetical protein